MIGLVIGVSVGLLLAGLAATSLAHAQVNETSRDVRAGWDLAPALVATRDLAPGTRVTMKDLAERKIPRVILTASMIKPEAASMVANLPLEVPVQAGDPLEWAYFTGLPSVKGLTLADSPVVNECERASRQIPSIAPADVTAAAIRERMSKGGAR